MHCLFLYSENQSFVGFSSHFYSYRAAARPMSNKTSRASIFIMFTATQRTSCFVIGVHSLKAPCQKGAYPCIHNSHSQTKNRKAVKEISESSSTVPHKILSPGIESSSPAVTFIPDKPFCLRSFNIFEALLARRSEQKCTGYMRYSPEDYLLFHGGSQL